MKKLIITAAFLCAGWPALAQNGGEVGDNYKKTYSFLRGESLFDQAFWEFFTEMKVHLWSTFDMFIVPAKIVGLILAIIFFASRSYDMLTGDKPFEVMPILRPFALLLLISFWSGFVSLVSLPTDIITVKTQRAAEQQMTVIDNLRLERAEKIYLVANELMTLEAEAEGAEKEATNIRNSDRTDFKNVVEGVAETIFNPVIEFKNRLQMEIKLLASQLIELLAVWILRLAVYLIYTIQIIYSTILIIFGPFAVAMSILPAFRDSLVTWVARFISVNLYAGIGYLIIFLTGMLQEFAMQSEINKYNHLLEDRGDIAGLVMFASNGYLGFGTVLVVFLVGAVCMFTVPSISTWIISTSGISSAASTFARQGSAMMVAARKAVTKGL